MVKAVSQKLGAQAGGTIAFALKAELLGLSCNQLETSQVLALKLYALLLLSSSFIYLSEPFRVALLLFSSSFIFSACNFGILKDKHAMRRSHMLTKSIDCTEKIALAISSPIANWTASLERQI